MWTLRRSGGPDGPPPLRLFAVPVAVLDDLGVGQVRRLGEGEEIVRAVAVRALPLFAVIVAAFERHIMEGALFRLVLPDAGRDQSDADLADRGVLRFRRFVLLRVLQRHFSFLFCSGRLQCQPVISVCPAKADRDARTKTEGMRPPGTAVFVLGAPARTSIRAGFQAEIHR